MVISREVIGSEVNEAFALIKFEHRDDWTLRTRSINAHFSSVTWYPIVNYANIEIVNVKWLERSMDIREYFNGLSKKGLIYEVPVIRHITGRLYLVGFMGPYQGTVRERLVMNNILYFNSFIENGQQNWLIMAPMDKVMDLKESLKGIGKVTYFKVQLVKSTRDVLLVVMRNNMMSSYVRLALTGSELNTLRSVWKLGYFNLNNRPTLSDVSVMLNKNKSTIDRQIKSAIHKLVNYVINIT